jgi:hypothetical protein
MVDNFSLPTFAYYIIQRYCLSLRNTKIIKSEHGIATVIFTLWSAIVVEYHYQILALAA